MYTAVRSLSKPPKVQAESILSKSISFFGPYPTLIRRGHITPQGHRRIFMACQLRQRRAATKHGAFCQVHLSTISVITGTRNGVSGRGLVMNGARGWTQGGRLCAAHALPGQVALPRRSNWQRRGRHKTASMVPSANSPPINGN